MSKKLLNLVLVCILFFPIGLTAKEKQGAVLIVKKLKGQHMKGELIAIRQNSLLLKEHDSGADVTAVVGEIESITVVKKSKAGKGALYGFGLGATGGGLYGLLLFEPSEHVTRIQSALTAAVFIGIFGVFAGLIVGGSLGKEKIIQIEGKSDSETHEILEYLRKKAGIPDYN